MAKRPTKPAGPVPVESITHKDARTNIPTQELRGFVATEEEQPPKVLYPRDPSLDPQLVWKGKDEQDASPLEVPAVPIYIQEKIHPQALIELLRDTAKAGQKEPELSLFDDFNGIDEFEKKVDFYHHDQNWSNRMILGDSLLVMTSLAEKEGLKGKVQTIYFDPPYGIKFGSNWQVSTRNRDVKDGKVVDATRQPEQIRAFRDTWKLGVHSYLAYIRDRLVVAREVLTESGTVFVQIGDENIHLVRCILDEVFGSENFVSLIAFAKTTGASSPKAATNVLADVADFVICYAFDLSKVKYRPIYREKTTPDIGSWIEKDGNRRKLKQEEERFDGRVFTVGDLTSQTVREAATTVFDVTFGGRIYRPGGTRGWATTPDGFSRLIAANRLVASGDSLRFVRYIDDFPVTPLNNIWTDTVVGQFTEAKVYVVQTSLKVVERCLLMTTDPGDLVLDPTCGSGTTAYVSEQWGRRWITIDTSRVALALARTRLMAAKYPYYLLADSPRGLKKEGEIGGKVPPDYQTTNDIRRGFVYKRVPHVTLKSIANNPDIKDGMTRDEIDAAIARHAETETLYDKPYEDPKRIRVTGPFTVESLSPHRMISTDDDRPATEPERHKVSVPGQFETMILDNLRKAGVQNTRKKERLVFDRLEPYAGRWIHATGTYTGADGRSRRAAVSIGPEHGTVGPKQVQEAAKEAVQGVGFDLLIVCGFAFDPYVNEDAKQYGKLTVLPTRMNHDLAMGDELLKKTGAGNLFTVFGEPDVDIDRDTDGNIVVRINGLEVYDPTTGQIRSNSTDDIACWFIDTGYNGESFFVRHAYFTGAGEPYEKLKRALRAEIDEATWSTLYSTVSRPFAPPEQSMIAVKVINHYGDEVLKVFEV
jgi:adenine-specific DNA-methyltransferase